MGYIYAQTSDDQVISIPAGTHVGTIILTKHNVTFEGPEVGGGGEARLQADGTGGATQLVIQPYPPQTGDGLPVSRVTYRNVTLDGAQLAGLTAVIAGGIYAGPLEIVLENVKIRGTINGSYAIIADGVNLVIGGGNGALKGPPALDITGDGFAISLPGLVQPAPRFEGRHVRVRGCQSGVIVSNGAGYRLYDWDVRPWYWAAPHNETITLSSVTRNEVVCLPAATVADLSIYDFVRCRRSRGTYTVGDAAALAAIAGLRQWDRIELSGGEWTQVIRYDADGAPVLDIWRLSNSWEPYDTDPTGDTATVYQISITNRMIDFSDDGVTLTFEQEGVNVNAHWRQPGDSGATDTVPETTDTFDIVCTGVGGGGRPRNIDIGGLHLLANTAHCSVEEFHVEGGWSDGQTYRGKSHHVVKCSSNRGQDMSLTDDPEEGYPHHYEECEWNTSGIDGVAMIGGGSTPSRFVRCTAKGNGTQRVDDLTTGGTTALGYGISIDTASVRSSPAPAGLHIPEGSNYNGRVQRLT